MSGSPFSSSSSRIHRHVHAATSSIFALIIVIFLLIPLLSLLVNNNTTTTNNLFDIFFKLNPFSISTNLSCFWRNTNDNNKEDNLSSSSRALSPDLSKCGPVILPYHAITSSNCCPPLPSGPIINYNMTDFNYMMSSTDKLRVRKPAHLVDEEFIAKFEKGIALMKALPEDDPRNFIQQAKVHCAYCSGGYPQRHPFGHLKIDIHSSWLFYPFHRWYIYFFERILAHLIGDPTFALPYWNWDSVEGMQMPSYFANPNSSLHNKLRHLNHTPPHLVDLYYHRGPSTDDPEQQVSNNLAIMYKQMVLANTKELFMGSPYRLGDQAQPGIGTLELAPHNTLHTWTGAAHTPNHEDMGSFYTAARDPLFYPHHSNMDRMWYLWTTVLDGGAREDYRHDPDWLDSEFFFHDENANLVRVKIRDCLDTKKLGYVYQEAELPWLTASPKPRRTRKQRELAAAKNNKKKKKKPITSTELFPLVLDSKVSAIVKRPNKEEKDQEEEVLVIEIIDLQCDKNVKFDVHMYDDDDDEKMMSGPDKAEFVGTFVSLAHGHGRKINTRYMIGISSVLVVTLLPKLGNGMLAIGSIHIQFLPK